jgi:hypothetical protein
LETPPVKSRLALVAALLLAGCGASRSVAPPAPLTHLGAQAVIPNPTMLQRHVMFFDANHDGTLKVAETRAGLRRLGVNRLTGLGGALFIHLGLREAGGAGTDLEIAKIHLAKHKSDTGCVDAAGHFDPRAFARMMTFDTNHSGSLSWTELKAMIAANKQDARGSLASRAEFGLLIKIGADTTEREGTEQVAALSEARLRSVYAGDVFEDIARAREQGGTRAEVVGPLPD